MFQMDIISRVFKTAVTILKIIFFLIFYMYFFLLVFISSILGGFFVHGLFLVKSFGYNKIHTSIIGLFAMSDTLLSFPIFTNVWPNILLTEKSSSFCPQRKFLICVCYS